MDQVRAGISLGQIGQDPLARGLRQVDRNLGRGQAVRVGLRVLHALVPYVQHGAVMGVSLMAGAAFAWCIRGMGAAFLFVLDFDEEVIDDRRDANTDLNVHAAALGVLPDHDRFRRSDLAALARAAADRDRAGLDEGCRAGYFRRRQDRWCGRTAARCSAAIILGVEQQHAVQIFVRQRGREQVGEEMDHGKPTEGPHIRFPV